MSDKEKAGTAPIVIDEEYKEAIQPVVDNNMRTDILGPHFCRILKEHSPSQDEVVALVAKEIVSDPTLKAAVNVLITEHNKNTKMVWVDRAVGAFGTILFALLIWGIEYVFTHPVFQNSANTTPTVQPAVSKA